MTGQQYTVLSPGVVERREGLTTDVFTHGDIIWVRRRCEVHGTVRFCGQRWDESQCIELLNALDGAS